MTRYVFLGPSLPIAEARRLLDATYLPPVQQGDILRLIDRGAEQIGIIDGYFEVVPAVWHKEILLALEAGVRVFGAASMGALRAAELHAFGMIGVGEIFGWLRDGVIVRDDEVAVVHAPAEMGYLPLSDALVDLRDACDAAVRAGVIDDAAAAMLQGAAEAMPFGERSYAAASRALKGISGAEERWLRFCRERGPGLKARDAMALLRAMAEPPAIPAGPACFGRTERTTFLNRLRLEVDLARFGAEAERAMAPGSLPTGLDEPRGVVRRTMLLRVLAREAAERFGWELTPDEVSDHASRLCIRLQLEDPAGRQRWMATRALSEDMFWRFVNDSLLVAKLDRLFEAEIDAELIDHLSMVAEPVA